MKRCHLFIILVTVLFVVPAVAKSKPAGAPKAEFRALWVDGFHAGIRTPEEAAILVADAKRANFNVLIVQVRRRGDSFYTQSLEPPVDEPPYDPGFDALAYVIQLAHAQGLEVHAWVNAMPVWRVAPPPRDPRHVFNQHGPEQSGEANWLTASPSGETKFPVGYFLDAGHPAAADHVAQVCLNLVKNYKLDGIHLDYIRYPETEERSDRGAPVGYNAVSLERFRRATHRTDTPAPGDAQWIAWRRQQITNLVRRIYLEAKAVNPRIRVSAAVIPWGKPPAKENDFAEVAPMQRVFQDWHGWLKDGYLDLAIPMNYAREDDPKVRDWFNGWIRWEKRHQHRGNIVVGIGAYLNEPKNTLAQIERVRRAEHGKFVEGVSFFSYYGLAKRAPAAAAAPPAPSAVSDASTPTLIPAAIPVAGATPAPAPGANAAPVAAPVASAPAVPPVIVPPTPSPVIGFFTESGVFAQAVPVPKPDWLEHPREGWVAGTVRAGGAAADGATVELRRKGLFHRTQRAQTDGNGFFGFSNLKPGHYRVRSGQGRAIEIEVAAGQVTRIEMP